MGAHVLLNLINKLGKRDSILCLFCKKFNKFNNTRARMLDSIYHMTLRLLSGFPQKLKKKFHGFSMINNVISMTI